MNYKLKYANQFVVGFILVALLLLISFTILIALKQNVFEKKLEYRTILSDATGLSTQTQLLFKGFEIGRVKSFSLNKDGWIYVNLRIYQKYRSFFLKGSVINRLTNPLTNKTQLEFVQNNRGKELIPENTLIISTDTSEGLTLYKSMDTKKSSDMITSIVANLDRLVQELGKDNNPDKGALFRFLYHLANVSSESEQSMKQVNGILKEASKFTSNLNKDNNQDQGSAFRLLYNAAEITDKVDRDMEQVEVLLTNLNKTLLEYQSPDSLLIKLIDPTGENLLQPVKGLINSLDSNLKETKELLQFFNRQKPEISTMVNHINSSLDKAQKTIDALNNNPLLKSGIPKQNQPVTGTGQRIKELPNE